MSTAAAPATRIFSLGFVGLGVPLYSLSQTEATQAIVCFVVQLIRFCLASCIGYCLLEGQIWPQNS